MHDGLLIWLAPDKFGQSYCYTGMSGPINLILGPCWRRKDSKSNYNESLTLVRVRISDIIKT